LSKDRPTYTSIYTLNFQALFIPSSNNPDLGFLGGIIPATQYAELNNDIAYVVPKNPGLTPAFNPDATKIQINEAIR